MAAPKFSAVITNVDPTLFANRDPNASIHDFDLNLISFNVGIYKLSRTG